MSTPSPAEWRHRAATRVYKTAPGQLVLVHTEGCIASHARGAARRGATTEEVAEALGVTIMINGGPGTVHAPRAFAAFQAFAAQA